VLADGWASTAVVGGDSAELNLRRLERAQAQPAAELKGDRCHDAYAEKLRRSVEAIQGYTAGLALDEQFAITGSLPMPHSRRHLVVLP
jgi:hypothetical protein